MYGLVVEGHFDAVHFLPNYYGKCENLHGHRWRVVATLEVDDLGTEGTEQGMVLDFSRAKQTVADVCHELDHTFLVQEGSLKPATIQALTSEGFSLTMLPFRTTAENLAHHLYARLAAAGLPVAQVEVDETPNNRCFYRP